MSELLFDRQRTALCELLRLLEDRRQVETELTTTCAGTQESSHEEVERARRDLHASRECELAGLDARFEEEQKALTAKHAAEEAAGQRALIEARRRLEADETKSRERLESQRKDAVWTCDSLLEGGQKRVQEELSNLEHQVAANAKQTTALWGRLAPMLARFRLEREDLEPENPVPPALIKHEDGDTEPLRDPQPLLSRADTLVQRIEQMPLLRWIAWPATVGLTLLFCVLGCLPALRLQPWFIWLSGGLGAGLMVGMAVRLSLRMVIRRRTVNMGSKLAIFLAQAEMIGEELLGEARPASKADLARLRQHHAAERQKAEARYKPQLEQLTQRIRTEREALEQKHQAAAKSRKQQADKAVLQSRQRYQQTRAACLADHEQRLKKAETDHTQRLAAVAQKRAQGERDMQQRWHTGIRQVLATFRHLKQVAAGVLSNGVKAPPALSKPDGPARELAEIPEGIPFGTLTIEPRLLLGDNVPGWAEIPEQLAPLPAGPIHVPAFLAFPRRVAVLMEAQDQGRAVAVQELQALMLRFLMALPPGKVRFTILDPVGLGDNFAAFMHLADVDEALVTSRIWTEPGHIEKQLADLTAHMENVIQKYLRSQFSSIEDYNAHAGEVAEAYRVLVVANFPVNFTADAARRLVSIVQSGSSCGVYALITVDTRQAVPQGFQMSDLEQQCLDLRWQDNRFIWNDPDLRRFPLALETPPDNERVIELVRQAGERSKDASKVEVPFSYIAPTEEQVWKSDSRKGISVPLGRAGAVRRMALELGKGTAQHVLVAGKTGSGKSSLLHAMITNLALHYSPEEVEMYLIDFKKGVEFKLYATCELPHARVLAIESEREFGLSVLQRLDAELRDRGERFRTSGVNEVASYRDANPEVYCPRILLIVDEFQEFFTEDDRVSQESALLLDRLVRQGRAFGLHVMLGSQTLGGAFSLARSTIDQMAVRIALQCSEADAQLILNKDNAAARLLSRPGEAIYNNANGALEGNELFQVVWLPEEERENRLMDLHRRAERTPFPHPHPKPLVFEGNVAAELERNPILQRLQQGSAAVDSVGHAWLGEAIAIKEATAATFKQQTSSNLLIVGQNDEMALATLASALIGLAVQHPARERVSERGPLPASFWVLDGTGSDSPHFGYLKSVMADWPHTMRQVERAEVAATLTELVGEMNQRLKGTSSDRSVRYVLIQGLQRYREFRRADDDMGFGRRGADKTVSPLENLQALLRDGPGVGMHTLMWCDTLINLNRSLDRQGLRECGLRVLFQMSAADSSHLLDNPLASKLGRNRALFFHDEMASPEKFRPYGLPSLTWLAEVKQRLVRVRTAV